jgi:hypothetical protein
MDITGTLRRLALFAPPIDPMMLVEATAAGLSPDDVQSNTSGNVPPYRFTYLIDKAKQYASQVQGFGGALLSAIEKRDAQQLEVLRVTQQQNILAMTTPTKQADVDSAQNAIHTLNAQLDTAQFRHDYFQGLLEGGLNSGEAAEASLRTLSILTRQTSVGQFCLQAVQGLIPHIGSPFAMTFGGVQLAAFVKGFAMSLLADSSLFETLASASGQVAGWERRSDGWQHEVDMANKDITQITTQLTGANIRLGSALFSLRQEFPSVLNRLLHSPVNTSLTMSITPNCLPFFVASGAVQVGAAKLLLRTAASKTVENFTLSIDGNSISSFSVDPTMGGLWSADASAVFASGLFADHTIVVTKPGNLAPVAPPSGVTAAIDDTSLLDVMLHVPYQLTMSGSAAEGD